MQVELIEATENPEELVCTAARNDYRSMGVSEFTFEEVMDGIEADPAYIGEAFDALGYNREAFENRSDVTEGSVEENVDVIRGNSPLMLEAKKRTLLAHLMDSGHWGPFEHPMATVALEGVTRVLMAQLTRHRHFSFDVMSLRYVSVDDIEDNDSRAGLEERFQFPPFIEKGEVVSREGVTEIDSEYVERHYKAAYSSCVHHYQQLLDRGVPPEQARKVLPMGTKVNIVVSGSARAWMHVLNVRTKGNVQGETRRAADTILEWLTGWMPFTFERYREDVLPLKLNP